ncbi:LytR/AlgR family response regulator transcription factor [Rubrivivax sp. RP6-9]|uniref:LytR/AlgR family response regulator transcription factor n=1 Tax=Rubrivivax sp. RP6-9 TaxID=3415750 RepID=UPI003CC62CA5
MPRCTTLIAEDEPLARESLAEWVQALPQLELVACCADGDSALQALRALRPALVLLDIQMPGQTGLQVLRALAADGLPLPAVVFTTAYDAHALTAFELHAVDYLLKPFSQERFNDAVAHALATRREGDAAGADETDDAGAPVLPALEAAQRAAEAGPLTRVLVREHGRIVPLHVDAIEHLRSDTKYTALTSRGRSYLVRLPITSFEARLDPQRFLKVNRSCIVNLDFVEAMTPDESSQFVVLLRDGTRVTASRDVSKQLRAQAL